MDMVSGIIYKYNLVNGAKQQTALPHLMSLMKPFNVAYRSLMAKVSTTEELFKFLDIQLGNAFDSLPKAEFAIGFFELSKNFLFVK